MLSKDLPLKTAIDHLNKVIKVNISRVWKGYGTVVFLEFGDLQPDFYNYKGNRKEFLIGDWSLELEGDWLIKQDDKVLIDSKKAKLEDIKHVIKKIEGLYITEFKFDKYMTSVLILLSNNFSVQLDQSSAGFMSFVYNHRQWITFDKKRIQYAE